MSSESFGKATNPFAQPPASPRASNLEALAAILGPFGKGVARKIHRTKTRAGREERDLFLDPEGSQALQEAAVMIEQEGSVENFKLLQEAKAYLGESNVHGVADVERALGFKIDRRKIPPIPFRTRDFEKSHELQRQGIEEMLILCVGEDAHGQPMTGENMNETLVPQFKALDPEGGVFKFLDDCHEREFFTQDSLAYEWVLVTKACLPGSKSKYYSYKKEGHWTLEQTQDFFIECFADKLHIPRSVVRRPGAMQMVYAIMIHYLSTEKQNPGHGERLLWNEVFLSGTETTFRGHLSIDGHVAIGFTDTHGVFTQIYASNFMDRDVGICLLRDPLPEG